MLTYTFHSARPNDCPARLCHLLASPILLLSIKSPFVPLYSAVRSYSFARMIVMHDFGKAVIACICWKCKSSVKLDFAVTIENRITISLFPGGCGSILQVQELFSVFRIFVLRQYTTTLRFKHRASSERHICMK